MDRSIGRPAADLYLIDTETGARTKIKEHLADDFFLRASPGGRYLIYLQDDQYWTVDVATHATVNITKSLGTSFVNRESDFTVKQKPAFGIAGWTKDDAAVILYDKFDLWQVSPDGSRGTRLTDGAKNEVRHRYVALNPDEDAIDLHQPVLPQPVWHLDQAIRLCAPLQIDPSGEPRDEHLVLLDKSIDRLSKAKETDAYAFLSQSFASSPNVLTTSADFKEPKQATNTNANQSAYAWGHEELIDYKNSKGERFTRGPLLPGGL